MFLKALIAKAWPDQDRGVNGLPVALYVYFKSKVKAGAVKNHCLGSSDSACVNICEGYRLIFFWLQLYALSRVFGQSVARRIEFFFKIAI